MISKQEELQEKADFIRDSMREDGEVEKKTLREEFKKKFVEIEENDVGKTEYFGEEVYPFEVFNWIESKLKQREVEVREEKVTGETSDGYHTFNELYEFRKLYNAALFNQWADMSIYNVHKSWKHHDGKLCFGGGWFIVMADLPTGQISNHYEEKDWDLFRCEERELADKWDGHTAQDVSKRLLQSLNQNTNEK